LLHIKHKIDSWEQKLKIEDDVLSRVLKEYGQDQVKYRAGFMSLDTFNRKWKSNGQIRKSKDKVVKFHAEIKQYNKFRSGYNALAVELAKFLYIRNPKEVKVLIKDIDLLLVDLQRAIDDKEYTKAVLIASRSTVATEFGFLRF